jgi:hypothetical protein
MTNHWTVTALLALTLLLPNGWTNLISPLSVSRCCRGQKICCCRRAAPGGNSGPAAQANSCLPGCGQRLAPPAATGLPGVENTGSLSFTWTTSPAAALVIAACGILSLAFALFQRPPPLRPVLPS